jgi:hypothetical protein
MLDGLRYLPISLSYMGLFLLPLGVALLGYLWQKNKYWDRQQWLVFAGFCSVSIILFLLPQLLYGLIKLLFAKDSLWLQRYPYRMPLFNFGMFLDFGLGLLNPIIQPVVKIHEWWWAITIPALGIGGLLFTKAWKQTQFWFSKVQVQSPTSSQSQTLQSQMLFLWLWGGVALLSPYNPWRSIITDRYLLMAFAPFTLILAMDFRRVSSAVTKCAAVGTGIGLVISLMLFQNYMAWNSTVSIAQYQLMRDYQVPANAIAGIDALNGWYNSDAYMNRYKTRSFWDFNIGGKGPWVLDDQYSIGSVEPRPGYKVLKRIPYFSWLGWKEQMIIIFKRLSAEVKN